MRPLLASPLAVMIIALLAVAGCGGDDGTPVAATGPQPSTAGPATRAAAEEPPAAATPGATITAEGSEFGRMLFAADGQAIYIFENDPVGATACHGECAEAWPPVLTAGEPRAARGVRASLLGTIERPGGARQVTYAGKPLYTYAHERPGEVRCHDVDLHGGLWWVVGPDGERRP